MIGELLDILACPACRGSLELHVSSGSPGEVVSGHFRCAGCNEIYHIRNDVPFFSPSVRHHGVRNQQNTYSTWWDDYHDEQSIVDPSYAEFFYNSLKIRASEMEGKTILDAGCGNGRFSYVVSHYKPKLLVSFDISSGVIHAKRAIVKHNPDAHVAFVQGDVTRPPFKEGVFDIVFSWGVIHHTPRTPETFSTISRLVREGGQLGIYVYEFHPLYRYGRHPLFLVALVRSLFLIQPLRWLCSRLPAKVVHFIFVPIYYMERASGIGVMGCHGPKENMWDKDRYFRVVIDRFKTRYASEHQLEEVMGWFQENGFDELRVGCTPRISVTGRKGKREGSAGVINITIHGAREVDESINKYISR